ncbi:LysR substrate-binding domain-containing protein [Delftia sp. PS-11]|uniref:LysR substrate-binding domain-containing protein n=1 Tax=Delftia sp. PS-11 TaxID=2767222 RepID=UPI0024580D0F|nr:LysR substrate-binding domain-containing protein [Delftia sp. PS-11]KAJ8742538.1 LysR family transcriptional regulator [Delftia sp. PS-11]
MELRHLRYFVAVAEQGNVSRAARKLFIAQPPLSAQLRQLEEEVGAALFTRLPRGVRLTPAGESFLEDARAILARAQQAPLRARERQHSRQSVVRLALVPSAMHSVLPGLLRRIADAGWLLRVEAREMITSQQLRALRAGELDLGLGRPGREETLPEEVAGMDDPYCLAVAPANPLAAGEGPLPLQAAAHEAFVGFSRYEDADYFDRTVALCLDAGFTPSIRHEAGQFVNVLALVACGLGVAIVPSSFATLYRGKLVFRPLQAPAYQSRLAVLAAVHARPDTQDAAPSDAARVAQAAALELRQFRRRLARLR